MVTIVERPVYDYGVSWVPWSWGSGGYGWPGSYYVNRPMPHFYGTRDGAHGGHGGPRPDGGGGPRPDGGGPRPGGGGPRPGGGPMPGGAR